MTIVDFQLPIEQLEKTSGDLGRTEARTKSFALRVIKLVDAMPRSLAAEVIGKQLLRSATSVGANYRAACRAQSHAEFAAQLSIVVEEADETVYWLELLRESSLLKPERLWPT